MRFGSACSGIEAASVAWGPLGWKAAWFSEIDPFACAILAHHYPQVPNLGDMTRLALLIRLGLVEAPDVLCGGTPCQAFSVAGLRKSLDDARGNLSLTFCEIANAIDDRRTDAPPAVIVWENVPGVLSTADNAFGCFLAGLAGEDDPLVAAGGKWTNAGVVYGPRRTVAWRVLDAQYFGLAQRRRRVFVVASARNDFDPAQVLFEWDGVRRDSAPSREAGEEAARCLVRGSGGGQRYDGETETFVTHSLRGEGFDASEDGTGRGTPLVPAIMPTMTAGPSTEAGHNARSGHCKHAYIVPVLPFDTTQITSATNRCKPEVGDPCHPLAAGAHAPAIAFDSRQDPVSSDRLFGSLGSSSPQAQAVAYSTKLHNAGKIFEERTACLDANSPPPARLTAMQVRRLTPRECERLQGFPDDYTLIPWRKKPADECPDGPRYKALGNSWAVPNVRWIGARIAGALAR